ncbi:hypothetical protein B0E45_32595 [Sinorhizobium sp. A49]|uniref:hypothetical protein n=1 Tax=Sinorhizobium sp. A49 TaxID=1945861 RepID=UPI000985B0A5|nr:hypothetical protein [Sinorhizobium sp. A49]OOG61737.1 hypothetical protein B0E45_32595 [Sinorhizobium sp. A49]
MTAFNPNDPVHAAAKDYRDAAKALFDTRNESSLDKNGILARRHAALSMSNALHERTNLSDEIHSFASRVLRFEKTPKTLNEWQRRENELIRAVENAMLKAGMVIQG